MNNIIELAKQAELGEAHPKYPDLYFFSDLAGLANLQKFADLVGNAKLDQAKKACESLNLYGNQERKNWQVATIGDCAAAIESLKEQTP